MGLPCMCSIMSASGIGRRLPGRPSGDREVLPVVPPPRAARIMRMPYRRPQPRAHAAPFTAEMRIVEDILFASPAGEPSGLFVEKGWIEIRLEFVSPLPEAFCESALPNRNTCASSRSARYRSALENASFHPKEIASYSLCSTHALACSVP